MPPNVVQNKPFINFGGAVTSGLKTYLGTRSALNNIEGQERRAIREEEQYDYEKSTRPLRQEAMEMEVEQAKGKINADKLKKNLLQGLRHAEMTGWQDLKPLTDVYNKQFPDGREIHIEPVKGKKGKMEFNLWTLGQEGVSTVSKEQLQGVVAEIYEDPDKALEHRRKMKLEKTKHEYDMKEINAKNKAKGSKSSAEIQMMDRLIAGKVAKNDEEAFALMRQAKSDPRKFVFKYVENAVEAQEFIDPSDENYKSQQMLVDEALEILETIDTSISKRSQGNRTAIPEPGSSQEGVKTGAAPQEITDEEKQRAKTDPNVYRDILKRANPNANPQEIEARVKAVFGTQ